MRVALNSRAVQQALHESGRALAWPAQVLEAILVPVQPQLEVALRAFQRVVELARASRLLLDQGLVGAASALTRPQCEALIRGVWLGLVPEEKFLRFEAGKHRFNLEIIESDIREGARCDRPKQALFDMYRAHESILHGSTHQDYQSLMRYMGSADIPPAEIVSLSRFSTSMALHAALEALDVVELRGLALRHERGPEALEALRSQGFVWLQAYGLLQHEAAVPGD